MLRAQVSQKPAERARPAVVPEPIESTATVPSEDEPAPKRRTTRRTAATAADAQATPSVEDASAAEAEKPAPKRRTTRTKAASTAGDATADGATADKPTPKPRAKRASTKAAAAQPAAEGGSDSDAPVGDAVAAAPKRRTTRKSAATDSPESA
jgi:ribonuclease E